MHKVDSHRVFKISKGLRSVAEVLVVITSWDNADKFMMRSHRAQPHNDYHSLDRAISPCVFCLSHHNSNLPEHHSGHGLC